MSIVKDLFFMEAERKVAETVNNEIKIENFEIQAKQKNIMKIKPQPCKSKMWGLFEYNVDHNYLNHSYGELFNYLVKKEIIISKIDLATYFTADFVYTLPTPFIDKKEFQTRMNDKNKDYPELLKCYEIDNNILYDLLKNYKYNLKDEYEGIGQELGEIFKKKSRSRTRSIKRSIKKGGKGKTRNKKNKKIKKMIK